MQPMSSVLPHDCPPWLPSWIWGRLHERQASPRPIDISVSELERSLRAEHGGALMPEDLPEERPAWLPEAVWTKLAMIKAAYVSTVVLR